MSVFEDLTGLRYGRLVVLEQAPHSKCGRIRWLCLCDCGQTTITQACNLKNGQISCSCGLGHGAVYMHGQARRGSRSGAFCSWLAMRRRCVNDLDYIRKGVRVCDRWQNSFAIFRADMGERPAGMTIDRVKGHLGYEPGNCRWATATEQARNRPGFALTDDDVAEICGRVEHGETRNAVAIRFNIQRATVRRALARGGFDVSLGL
jgi:hypothetical protein